MAQPGTVPGCILELHAARAALGTSPGINSPLTTQFFDTSGNGNHGTLQTYAGTEASGYAGTGTLADPYRLVGDGASDYVSLPDLGAAEDKTFTYEVLALAGVSAAELVLMSEGSANAGAPYCYLSLTTAGRLLAYSLDDAGAVFISRTGAAVDHRDGAVHQFGVAVGAGSAQLYCDGAADGAPVAIGAGTLTLTKSAVGALIRSVASRFFAGGVCVARFYPFALTPAQWAQNYAAGTGWVEVTTTAITGISSAAATSGGTIPAGGEPATARGVCWNTTGTPTTADSKTTDGSGAGAYASALTGLSAATTYHVRAYATSAAGTVYGAEVTFTTRAFAASVWTPAQSVRSLRIGSDVLGWQDFPADHLGVRTKQMPGVDGSLDFVIPGDFAWQHRNVIAPEAQVVLTVDGETDFGGHLSCDPLRHRLGAQDTLELVATGPWGMGARNNRWAYLGSDTDLSRWFPVRSQYAAATSELELLEDSGKFAVTIDGQLLIKAEGGRAFDQYAKTRLCYHLFDGLFAGAVVYGMDFKYRSYLPTDWEARIHTATDPWAETLNLEWSELGDVAAWSATQSVDFAMPRAAVLLTLFWNSVVSTTPTTAPYIRLKDVVLYGRGSVGVVDRAVTIADILSDSAYGGPGGTTLRITGLTTQPGNFIIPYPTTTAGVMAEATLGEAAPVEAYFDHTGDGFRFTANTRPASVTTGRNRLWAVGGRGGEDLSGLQRDWEATAQQVEVLYAVTGDATVPDGTVRLARYPASTLVLSNFPLVEPVDLTGEPPMTAASAAQYAQTIYAARQDSLYAGDVVLGATAFTDSGQDVPTVKLRPGDRLKSAQLLDVDDAGLYIQNVAYDFRTERCAATVGEPWDPLGYRPKSAATQVIGSGAHGGAGRLRRGRGYLRRSGVV